jgi:diaminopimelate decarboxylase/aspartate kinase
VQSPFRFLLFSERYSITLTLDHIPGGIESEQFAELTRRLGQLGSVDVQNPVSVVSIVGRHLRTVLHQLGGCLDAFENEEVLLLSESSEDLNLSFVVRQGAADSITSALHARLLESNFSKR